MTLLSYSNTDAQFTDLTADAEGADVLTRYNDIKTFLNGNNLDATSNINAGAVYPWTARHSWTITDTANINRSLAVAGVQAASKYGDSITSSAAQVNASLCYRALTNAGSSVSISEYVNAGTGDTVKVSNSNTGACFLAETTSTGYPYKASIRSLTGLNAPLVAKVLTTPQSVNNTADETVISDLTVSFPANFLQAGTIIRGTINGWMDSDAAGGDVRLLLRWGGVAGVILLDTGVFNNAANLANSLLKVEFTLICITTGVAGTMEAQGNVMWNSNTTPTNYGMGVGGTGAANLTTIVIDTTVAKDLVFDVKWSAADADDEVNIRQGIIEIIR